jgi:ADP-heptose:LPS heptosyltransferase
MTMKWATVCRYGGIGDNLVASSVLPGLKQKYGHVEVITQEPQHVVFENNPHIDKLSVQKRDFVPGNAFQDWHWIRSKESDFFVNLSHSMETLLAFLPGQSAFQWPAGARRKLADKSYLEAVHDICGLDYSCIEPNFYPTEAERAEALETKSRVGDRYIAWVLNGTRIDKIYPWATYAIGRLIHELDIPVVLLGAPSPAKDFEHAVRIQDHVRRQNGSLKNLHACMQDPNSGKPSWSIRRVLTFAQHADLVIGPDTGPMWATAIHNMPKIMLLSHASPTNITKHWRNTTTLHADQTRVDCWPCHKLHDVIETCRSNTEQTGAACISDISVDSLLQHAEKVLSYRPESNVSPLMIGDRHVG